MNSKILFSVLALAVVGLIAQPVLADGGALEVINTMTTNCMSDTLDVRVWSAHVRNTTASNITNEVWISADYPQFLRICTIFIDHDFNHKSTTVTLEQGSTVCRHTSTIIEIARVDCTGGSLNLNAGQHVMVETTSTFVGFPKLSEPTFTFRGNHTVI